MAEPREEQLTGGCVSEVVRVGATVRRSTGPWTPAVHALLTHLDAVGFPYSPRALGTDDRGREILTYLDGEPAARPWPTVLRTDDGLRQVGRLVRDLGDAVAGFVPPADARWRSGVAYAPGMVMRHGDLAPWNTLWQGDRLTGLLDWDFAEPAPPLWDLAQAAWYFVPLRAAKGWQASGFATEPDHRHRLGVLCAAAGADPADVLAALTDLQTCEYARIRDLGAAGVEPFATFLARGDLTELAAESHWRTTHL
ncbi:MAG TPA: phosphotransferase [Actinocatenispora sp.]